jgi:hypothetical protein
MRWSSSGEGGGFASNHWPSHGSLSTPKCVHRDHDARLVLDVLFAHLCLQSRPIHAQWSRSLPHLRDARVDTVVVKHLRLREKASLLTTGISLSKATMKGESK